MVDYLSKEIVIDMNRMLTKDYGQPHVILAEANLEHTLEAMKNYGENIKSQKEKVLTKAAFFLYHLAYTDHVFIDGNKRTAFIGTIVFIAQNSTELVIEKSRIEETTRMIKEVAEGKHTISYIRRWLETIYGKKMRLG